MVHLLSGSGRFGTKHCYGYISLILALAQLSSAMSVSRDIVADIQDVLRAKSGGVCRPTDQPRGHKS